MAGAIGGGGLGYCGGVGGYLALALDEFGNFSNGAACASPSSRGRQPNALVIRGPVAQGAPIVDAMPSPWPAAVLSAGLRPGLQEVLLRLRPAVEGPGFVMDLLTRTGQEPLRVLRTGLRFPFAPPASLSIGVAATTGAAVTVHEIGEVVVTPLAEPREPLAQLRFEPAAIAAEQASTLVFEMAGAGAGSMVTSAPLVFRLPPGMHVARPLVLGGTCLGGLAVSAEADAVIAAAGTRIPAAGCRLTAQVKAATPGTFVLSVPPGGYRTNAGENTRPYDAALRVAASR